MLGQHRWRDWMAGSDYWTIIYESRVSRRFGHSIDGLGEAVLCAVQSRGYVKSLYDVQRGTSCL